MQRELTTFPLSPFLRSKLVNCGFTIVEDVIGLKPSELSRELGIEVEEAVELLQLLRCSSSKPHETADVTALDLLHAADKQQPIVTFSEQLDSLLGGGVALGKMTEFCGPPGVGKTQICMQLAVDVQIPTCFGGSGGQAVYIDTEGSFVVERMVDIAQTTVKHCVYIASIQPHGDNDESLKNFTLESILSGVHCFRCYDHVQLLAVARTLDAFLGQHPIVKLVVIDSIAFHFRQDFDDFLLRSRLLSALAQTFNRIISTYNVAVRCVYFRFSCDLCTFLDCINACDADYCSQCSWNLSVCLSVILLHCRKTAERIKVLFGVKTPGAQGTLC